MGCSAPKCKSVAHWLLYMFVGITALAVCYFMVENKLLRAQLDTKLKALDDLEAKMMVKSISFTVLLRSISN